MAIPVRAREDLPEKPSDTGSWRAEIPATGLREYWYPALLSKKVGKGKPTGVRMLGEDLVFFRDPDGRIVGFKDLCPHRGAKLSMGVCHFPGTLTCPYHGWTYNAGGEVIAAFIEGPESRVPESGIHATTKIVKEFRGMVWVWMGEGEPVPLEEDVPEEFLEPGTWILTAIRPWPINWRPLIENAIDGHAPYVHRNSLVAILFGVGPLGQKLTPQLTRDGKGICLMKGNFPPPQQDYPGLGRYPRVLVRRLWQRILGRWRKTTTFTGKPYTQEIVLPGVNRITYPNHLYMRWGVPIDEGGVRNFYWHVIRGSTLWKLGFCLRYYLFRCWAMNILFSEQDRSIVGAQNYGTPERLSWTDGVVVGWRKMVLHGYHTERVKRTHQGKIHLEPAPGSRP